MSEPKPAGVSIYDKLSAEGPISMDTAEANELRGSLNQLLMRVAQLEATDRVNKAMAEALQKHRLELIREDNPDGTLGWNLQHKPQPAADEPLTVN